MANQELALRMAIAQAMGNPNSPFAKMRNRIAGGQKAEDVFRALFFSDDPKKLPFLHRLYFELGGKGDNPYRNQGAEDIDTRY